MAMFDCSDGLCFGQEANRAGGIGFEHPLDGDETIESGLPPEVDRSHAAACEFFLQDDARDARQARGLVFRFRVSFGRRRPIRPGQRAEVCRQRGRILQGHISRGELGGRVLLVMNHDLLSKFA
jgi:hypothetical protein